MLCLSGFRLYSRWVPLFEHQRVPATRFNNIFLKLCDRHATYCYLQVAHKSFLTSGTFFLGCEATEQATISQVINSRHSYLFDCKSTETRNQHQQVARLGHLDNIFSRPRPSLALLDHSTALSLRPPLRCNLTFPFFADAVSFFCLCNPT